MPRGESHIPHNETVTENSDRKVTPSRRPAEVHPAPHLDYDSQRDVETQKIYRDRGPKIPIEGQGKNRETFPRVPYQAEAPSTEYDQETDVGHCQVIKISPAEIEHYMKLHGQAQERKLLERETRWNRLKEDRYTREGRENRERLKHHLWPEGMKSPMKQGRLGDCYAVAALDSLKNWHDGEDRILDSIREVGSGRYIVHFFNPDKQVYDEQGKISDRGDWEYTEISEAELLSEDHRGLQKGAIGDQLIERALMRYLHAKRGGEEGKTMAIDMERFSRGGKERRRVEGGQPYRALYQLAGPDFEKKRGRDRAGIMALLTQLDQEFKETGRMSMANAASKRKAELTPYYGRGRGIRRFVRNMMHEPIVPNHAYRISHVDLGKGVVHIVNPHNTAKAQAISVDEFFHFFIEAYVVSEKEDGISNESEGSTREIRM